MRYLTLIFFSIFLIFSSKDIYSQDIKKINIDNAIEMALYASEDVEIKNNEFRFQKSVHKETISAILPKIESSATWSNNFLYADIPQNTYTKDYDLMAQITVTQPIFTFGKLSNAINAAKQAVEVSFYNKETTKQEIIYNTKIAYFNAHLTKRILDISQESYNRAIENKKILEERSADGRVSKQNNIKISADISSRAPIVNNARADFLSAVETLKVVIGLGSNDKIELTEPFRNSFKEMNKDTLISSLYQNQPMIKALDNNIRVKESLAKSKKAQYFPTISAFAKWDHKGSSDNYYLGSENLEDEGIAGLKIDVPIWNGGKTKEQLTQARIETDIAKLESQKGKENYLLELNNSLNDYHEFIKTLESNIEAIRWANESFQQMQDLFKSGQISLTDLNDAELLLTNQKINKELTIFNINMTLAKIERITLTGVNNE